MREFDLQKLMDGLYENLDCYKSLEDWCFDNGIFELTEQWFERYDGDGDNPKVAASVS